ncbi:hypothetical protein E2562_006582 [Oryza meyeriana var. granulata]|uniref:Uncharacterized protein n=1 Tax=Oryza meyeriana var. granulata TaxID=110450 RepID=A0A6G1EFR2_9ORYZ|nr:hypothetical protein E2562_006582 [Oryza meyeriana var. granulata]
MANPTQGSLKPRSRPTGRRVAPPPASEDLSRAAAVKRSVRKWSTWTMKTARVAALYGFIPLIIIRSGRVNNY